MDRKWSLKFEAGVEKRGPRARKNERIVLERNLLVAGVS